MDVKELRAEIRKLEADLQLLKASRHLVEEPRVRAMELLNKAIAEARAQLAQMVMDGLVGGTGGVPPVSVKGKS